MIQLKTRPEHSLYKKPTDFNSWHLPENKSNSSYLEVQSCFAQYSIHASTECAVQAPKIDLRPSLMYMKQHNTLEGTV